MDRRTFITLTAATGATTLLAGCRQAGPALVRFLPDETIVPGLAAWKPGVCTLCPSGCGLSVRVMDADVELVKNGTPGVMRRLVAKKFEGSLSHPVNHGGLCPRGQAAIQVTYHPDRIAQPLKRKGDRGSGQYDAISWDQAIEELAGAFNRIAAPGRAAAVAYLAAPGQSHRRRLVDRFLAAYGAPASTTVEVFDDAVLRRANQLSFGRSQVPTFDLGRAMLVVNFGGDLLGTWNAPVAHLSSYGVMRRGRRGMRGTLIQVEAHMSYTGASADQWIGARPGREGMLALSVAHVLMADGVAGPGAAGRAGQLVDGWAEGLEAYAPEKVAETTGVSEERIKGVARAMAETRPAVAVIGGAALAQTNGLFNALAVNALNALLGAVEQPGGLYFTPSFPDVEPQPAAAAPQRADELSAALLGGGSPGVELVLLDGSNPVYNSPPAWRMREALLAAPTIVSFGSFLDDSSVLADLILPDHSFLEGWADALPESGSIQMVSSVAAPVMEPLLDTRATPDVLLDVARRLQPPLEPLARYRTFEKFLQSRHAALPGAAAADPQAWEQVKVRGGWWASPDEGGAPPVGTDAAPADRGPAPSEPSFDGAPGEFPFHLLPYASQAFGGGSFAHLPWLQEMPDPLTSAMWSSWIEINQQTAARLGIGPGDIVEVASTAGTLRAPAVLSPALAPDVVAMPVGQGHEVFTRYASGRGVNPVRLLAPARDEATGALAWGATRVKIARAGGPDGTLVQFAGTLREAESGHARL